jgi:hypothetical protein
VDDVVRVRDGERAHDGHHELDGLRGWELPAVLEELRERRALQELEHHERAAAVLADLVNDDDVLVAAPRGRRASTMKRSVSSGLLLLGCVKPVSPPISSHFTDDVLKGRADRLGAFNLAPLTGNRSRGNTPETAIHECHNDRVVGVFGQPPGWQLGVHEILAGLERRLVIEVIFELGLPTCERSCDLRSRFIIERILPTVWESIV